MGRFVRLLVVVMISASLAVFANGSATLAAVRKVALGVAMDDGRNPAAVDAFTASVGRKPAIWTVWSDWGDNGTKAFPTAIMSALKDRAITPMVMWEPINPGNQTDCANWSNAAVLQRLEPGGDLYNYARTWAQAAKDHGGTVILRFMHELNGYWFIWGTNRCTNTPTSIKNVWKKVWNIFKGPDGVGATNVKFLWSISGAGYVKKVFPGNAYVDYLGLSAFNWGRPTPVGSFDTWRSMVTAFKSPMNALLNLSSTKPIIAAEVASAHVPDCSTCSKANWITYGYPAVRKKWPRVKAIVYLNIDLTGAGHPDWRLTTPPAALDAYKVHLTKAIFQGTIP